MTVVPRHRAIVPGLITALCLAAAAVLAAAPGAQPAKQPFTPSPLVASEGAELERLRVRLLEFTKLGDRLQTQARIARPDFDTLQRQGDALKPLLKAAQVQLSSAISKLKGAGLWNADLDAYVLDRFQKAGRTDLLNDIRAAGGPRAFMEKASSQFPLAVNEIDGKLRELAPKAAWLRLIEPLVGQPVQAADTAIRVARIALGIACLVYVPGCTTFI